MTSLQRALGNLAVLCHLPGQRRVPYLPQERWRALRDARVRSIVRYAAKSVPYYRDLFRARSIDPREIRTAADLDRLPLLEKDTIRQAPERFLSESVRRSRALPFVTSGSTSAPLNVYHDYRSMLANIAYGEREREVVARLCGKGMRWRELMVIYPEATFLKVLDFYRRSTFIPLRPQRFMLPVTEPVENAVEAVNRFQPDVIVGYAGYLEMLFRAVKVRGLRMHLPRLVIFGGEAMTTPGHDLITEQFGLPLIALYNAVESFKIGFMCEEGTDYHLHEDLCRVRIVDGAGQPAAAGELGEVVISNLVNRATVLLNYRLGDVASRATYSCACGRTLPLLTSLEGRVEDILILPDGTFVHPVAIWSIFKGRPEVLRYQLIQHTGESFELRLVMSDEETFHRLLPEILRELHARVGRSATIAPALCDHLEMHGTSGKFRAVISNRDASRPAPPTPGGVLGAPSE